MSNLNPLHYDSDGVMIGHKLVPKDSADDDGVTWCNVCGGHPSDPIHQPGYEEMPL